MARLPQGPQLRVGLLPVLRPSPGSQAELTRFTTVDMVDRAALVAVLGDVIIADARYDRWAGKDEAEVAFVVADEHHGRG